MGLNAMGSGEVYAKDFGLFYVGELRHNHAFLVDYFSYVCIGEVNGVLC